MTCTGPDCDKPIHGHGLCSTHLQQQRRGTPLRPILPPTPRPTTCTFPGCDKPYSGRGYCEGHLEQGRRGKPLTPLQQRTPAAGACADCDRPARVKGRCRRCYLKQRRATLKPPAETLNPRLRVAPDKARKEPRPPKPTLNPALPRNWDATRTKPTTRRQVSDNNKLSADLGPVGPLPDEIADRMRRHLRRRGLDELADMLGVAS